MTEDEPDSGYGEDDLKRIGTLWQRRIEDAGKREEKWSSVAERAEAIYACDMDYTSSADYVDASTPRNSPFNILHSSVNTVVPSIYNSTPSPDIRPRHNNADDQAKALSDAVERAIEALIDDDRLSGEIESLAQDSYLAGRGVIRLRYEPEVGTEIDPGTGKEFETIVDEVIGYQAVSWRDYREGPATRWRDVPWVAYRHFVSDAEMRRLSDETLAKLQVSPFDDVEGGEKEDHQVWEIWDKETRRVIFVCEGYVLSVTPDPMGLQGFFPQPKPVQPTCLTGKRTPICPYSAYESMAREINRTTARINKIVQGLRVRGIISSDATGDFERWAAAEDNEVVVSDSLSAAAKMSDAIAWWPVAEAMAVIAQLRDHRAAVKQDVYEIAGISDIVRGATDARETMGAQAFKVNFANLRVRRLIRQIESTSRDIIRMSAEVISSKFAPQTVARLAGVELTPELAQALQNPFDHFRIDVETDSTVAADRNAGKQEMGEFLTTTSAFMQMAHGIVQENPMAALPLAEIYSAAVRHFNLGKAAEDAVSQLVEGSRKMAQDAMQKAEQGGDEGPDAQEMQMKMAQMQADQAIKQAELQFAQQRHADEMGIRMRELALKEGQAQIDAQKLGLEAQKLGMAERAQQADEAAQAVEFNLKRQAQDAQNMKDAAELQLEAIQGRAVGIG